MRVHGAGAWRDYENRARSVGEKLARHAAQHRRAEASVAACAHDDEVGVLLRGDGGEPHRRPPDLDSPLSVRGTAAAPRDQLQYSLCPLGCGLSKPLELELIADRTIRVDRGDVHDDQSHGEPLAQRDCCKQSFASAS